MSQLPNEQKQIAINIAFTTSEKCRDAFNEVCNLVFNKIMGQGLNKPIEHCSSEKEAKNVFIQKAENFHSTKLDPKRMIAKYWLLIVCMLYSSIKEISKDEPDYSNVFVKTVLGIFLIKIYQNIFASIPLQGVGTRSLDSTTHTEIALEQKFDKTMLQTQRAGLLGYYRFFSGDVELERALEDKRISSFDRDAMVRGLFAVKNGSFECVSISALVILELVRRKVPALIERIVKVGEHLDPHSFIMVNRRQGNIKDIHSLNADCMIIDAWYGICLTIGEIRQDPCFYYKYPLLSLKDKHSFPGFMGDNPPEGYNNFLSKLDKVLAKKKPSLCEQIGLDSVFPRLD